MVLQAAEMVEDEVDPDSQSWGCMRGETVQLIISSSPLNLTVFVVLLAHVGVAFVSSEHKMTTLSVS